MRIIRITAYLSFVIAVLNSCKTEPGACFDTGAQIFETGTAVSFHNCSTDADEYEWDFGDSIISTDKSPVHVYQNSGEYLVSLNARSLNGNKSDRAESVITVNKANVKYIGYCLTSYDSTQIGMTVITGLDDNSIVLMFGSTVFCNAIVNGLNVLIDTQNYMNQDYQYIKEGFGSLSFFDGLKSLNITILVVDNLQQEHFINIYGVYVLPD
jgi:hypothetical protein